MIDLMAEFDRVSATLRTDADFEGLPQAVEALERIGASQMAAIVREAHGLFGPEGPPRDRDARQDRLEALTASEDEDEPEDVFDELDQRFFA